MDVWKALEGHHYKVKELADEWSFGEDFIRDLFEEEPDVVIFVTHSKGRRAYRQLRIPWHVAERVYRRFQVPADGGIQAFRPPYHRRNA